MALKDVVSVQDYQLAHFSARSVSDIRKEDDFGHLYRSVK